MKKVISFTILSLIILSIYSCNQKRTFTPEQQELFRQASEKGLLVNEGFNRCLRFVNGWLGLTDSATGLIPRNINDSISKDIWNAKDCAADNYPFMVLTCALLNRNLFEGQMTEMLKTEISLTSRVGSLPETYSFSKKGYVEQTATFRNN